MTGRDASRIIATVPAQLAQEARECGRRVEQLRQRERAGTNLGEGPPGGVISTGRASTTADSTAPGRAIRSLGGPFQRPVAGAPRQDDFTAAATGLEGDDLASSSNAATPPMGGKGSAGLSGPAEPEPVVVCSARQLETVRLPIRGSVW